MSIFKEIVILYENGEIKKAYKKYKKIFPSTSIYNFVKLLEKLKKRP